MPLRIHILPSKLFRTMSKFSKQYTNIKQTNNKKLTKQVSTPNNYILLDISSTQHNQVANAFLVTTLIFLHGFCVLMEQQQNLTSCQISQRVVISITNFVSSPNTFEEFIQYRINDLNNNHLHHNNKHICNITSI